MMQGAGKQQLLWAICFLPVLLGHSQAQFDTSTTPNDTGNVIIKTPYGCPKYRIFDHPWVKANVAVTYGLKTKDGLGSQVARMLGVYAIAHALELPYVHSPLDCIGHIGGWPHYRNASCSNLPTSDMQKLHRISRHIFLPSTMTTNTSSWHRHYMPRGTWDSLAKITLTALRSGTPTVLQLELVDEFISACPDIFYHVPQWRPKGVGPAATQVSVGSPVGASWLLSRGRSIRIVVHMRRGDLATASAAREVPAQYYINLVKNIIKELDALQQDSSVEWFTEPPNTPREHEDLARVRREVPNLTLMTDSDLLWTWHQMWTADIFVMSKSGYSFVPAVVNTRGMIIHAPAAGIRKCKIACAPSHWLEAADESGSLSPDIKAEIRGRVLSAVGPGAAAGSSHAFSGSVGMLPAPIAAGSALGSSSLLQPRFGPTVREASNWSGSSSSSSASFYPKPPTT